MGKAIEAGLRKCVRTMAGWPVIGRAVRIVVALVRLPEFKAIFLDYHYRQFAFEKQQLPALLQSICDANHRQRVFETQQLPALLQSLSDANHRQHVFETQQLPALLQSISDLNHRQLSSDHDRDNMVRSVPVALRKITRELTEFRNRLERATVSMERGIDETRRHVESVASLAECRIDELRIQLERAAASMEQRTHETRGQLESAVGSMEGRIDELRKQLEIEASSIGQVLRENRSQLDAVTSSTQQRIDETRTRLESITSSVQFLMGRVEFVRREVMFEMRYGAAPSGNGNGNGNGDGDGDGNGNGNGHPLKSKSEILSPKKLAAARSERLRLNLGCGHIPLAGYLNVDRRALPGVDIVAEVDDLPFGPAEVDEILSSHLLEHFPQEQLSRELLPYLVGLLRPGGEFRAVVPDAQAMIQNYASGSYPFGSLREVTFGAQDYDGDFHYNMFTPQSLAEALQAAGLRNVKLIEAGRRNGVCFEFEIAGSK
jgi:hypothetical protein